jgi:hypothetical protein
MEATRVCYCGLDIGLCRWAIEARAISTLVVKEPVALFG